MDVGFVVITIFVLQQLKIHHETISRITATHP